MKDDEFNEFANQFIQTWQENFAKLGTNNQIMELFAANLHNMQQFYDKPITATFGNTSKPGADELKWCQLERRIDALEKKLEKISQVKAGNKKNSGK